ncbi:neutral cholesterol ester hydrolase 1-like [Diadema antillarum]|uniref:neutral cholesterol ester hydrolase 1-like n=1 Tax=Diadema antillarum TaxID=105358 RepID=UPI003A8C731C
MKLLIIIFGLVVVAVLGYFFHTPIPEGLVDPWHFRLLVAGTKAGGLVSKVQQFFKASQLDIVRTERWFTEMAMSAPDVQVRGSNVSARYTEFDGIRVLLYEPVIRGKDPASALIFLHGGGYTLGSTKLHAPLTRQLAEELNMVVVSVEYRLAPEYRLPAPSEDAYIATRHLMTHAADYGVDPHRVVVGGDSAGGHLTAVLVQLIHDDPMLPNIKLQVLLYPWIQCFDFNTPSYQQYESLFGDIGLSKNRILDIVSINDRRVVDPDLIRHLRENRHTSKEFKHSRLYRDRLRHDIIFKKLGTTSTSNSGVPSTSSYSLSSAMTSYLSSIFTSYVVMENFFTQPLATVLTSLYPLKSHLSSSGFLHNVDHDNASSSIVDSVLEYRPEELFDRGNDTMWAEIREYYTHTSMAPLFREDFRGLPKAFVATADFDALRDDGIFYAHALESAGVEVTWTNYRGAWHTIAAAGPIADIPTGTKMIDDIVNFVRYNV